MPIPSFPASVNDKNKLLRPVTMARRQHLTLVVALAAVGFLTILYLMSSSPTAHYPKAELLKQADDRTDIAREAASADFGLSSSILTGGAIAPKLENKTAKYVSPALFLGWPFPLQLPPTHACPCPMAPYFSYLAIRRLT